MPDGIAARARFGRLARLARPSGAFAMVALDQRESLRTMLADRSARPIEDAALIRFKVDATRALSPAASAILVDVELGLRPVLEAGVLAPGCGLIVAADRLVQEPDRPVQWTEVDDGVLADDAIAAIADAYKLLVIWRDGEAGERERVVRRFVRACRDRDRPAIVEGIVRAAAGATVGPERHVELVVEAARELAALGADLYKAEVPTLGTADDAAIEAAAERMTALIRDAVAPPPPPRRPTRPSRASKERRLEEKRQRSEVKKGRRSRPPEE